MELRDCTEEELNALDIGDIVFFDYAGDDEHLEMVVTRVNKCSVRFTFTCDDLPLTIPKSHKSFRTELKKKKVCGGR